MDPRYSAQNILLCDLCESEVVNGHCELCLKNLCNSCVGKHLSDSSNSHRIVPYKDKSSLDFPKCKDHAKLCELFCEQCDIPVCTACLSSEDYIYRHHGDKFIDILKVLSSKKESLERDLQEITKSMYPKYKDILPKLKAERVVLEKHFEKLRRNVTRQGEEWHKEIDIVVKKRLTEVDEMKMKGLGVLNSEENKITEIITELNQVLAKMGKKLDSEDVFNTCAFISRHKEFKKFPSKTQISLPNFSHKKINTTDLCQLFGSLSPMILTDWELGYDVITSGTTSSLPAKPLLDEPELLTTIDTGHKFICSVACLSDEKIWICGEDNIIKLYNLKGKLLNSIKTKSGNTPRDITVTRSGNLVYTDFYDGTINIVKNEQIQEVLNKQKEMAPYNVSSTFSGDFLGCWVNKDVYEFNCGSKVVRYSDNKEIQSFGDSLYSSVFHDGAGYPHYDWHLNTKYICENRNLDICMADRPLCKVTVADQTGKRRFQYSGHFNSNPTSSHLWRFCPTGIATDSQSQILIAESNIIHILDQNGQFLGHIENCGLHSPQGLCVDSKDNLFVADSYTGQVKKIKYM